MCRLGFGHCRSRRCYGYSRWSELGVQRITVFTGMPSTLTVSTPQGRFTSTVVSPRDGLVLRN